MKHLAFLFLLLTVISAASFAYFEAHITVVAASTSAIACFGCGRKAIHEEWREEEMWWQDNNGIRFAMGLQTAFFVGVLLFGLIALIRWPELNAKGRWLCAGEMLSLSFLSWLSGREARVDAEKARHPLPSEPPQLPPKSTREDVLYEPVPGSGIWLAK